MRGLRTPLPFIRLLTTGSTCMLIAIGMASAQTATPRSSETTKDVPKTGEVKMSIEQSEYGKLSDGQQVKLFTCTNKNGYRLLLTDYGAIVVSMETPDRHGKLANITLGFPNLAGYEQRHPYFGATVGRFCNRIAKGQFTLDGKTYSLATNNGPNSLHGGIKGFDKQIWKSTPLANDEGVGVRFERVSPDGEEGYPGNLTVTATYTLTNSNELKIEFTASTDAATPINLTNHNYWNLSGAGSGDILKHELMLAADHYLAVDSTLIPTGELVPVAGTPLDFTKPTAIGARITQVGGDPTGYDHCYVVRSPQDTLRLAARVVDPASGRRMEIHTTQPGIQFYTGNFLDGSESSGGFTKHGAFCLETQHYPDAPNHADFPSAILRPGQKFHQLTVHKFSAE